MIRRTVFKLNGNVTRNAEVVISSNQVEVGVLCHYGGINKTKVNSLIFTDSQ